MPRNLPTLNESVTGLPNEPVSLDINKTRTEVGSYFVSNYPPFAQWKPEHIPAAIEALNQAPRIEDPLGLYIHIPFCRKRCKFCYFKVYTDKNAEEVETYLDALSREIHLYAGRAGFEG